MPDNVVELAIKRRRSPPVQRTKSPTPKQREPHPGEDFIFAMIEHHRVLSERVDVAIKVSGRMGGSEPGYEAAMKITSEAEDDLVEHSGLLFRSEPATLAGIMALLRYLRTLDEWQTPPGEALEFHRMQPIGWLPPLFEALENAIESIAAKT